MSEHNFIHISLDRLNQTAGEIIQLASHKTLWCFEGEMGSGKTTLIREICKVLNVQDEITSPSFSLVNEYRTTSGQTIFHFDFYRIRSEEEVYDIGYEDYFDSGNLCLIEWPSKIESILEGEDKVVIRLVNESETGRNIKVVL
jgi:tRNA threonylcarbamoyladenosine biosynthesis protein TsaE